MLIVDIEESTLSTPASIALIIVGVDNPVVAWQWRCIGISIVSFNLLTNSKAVYGFNRPAISLMARESAPISWILLDKSIHLSVL